MVVTRMKVWISMLSLDQPRPFLTPRRSQDGTRSSDGRTRPNGVQVRYICPMTMLFASTCTRTALRDVQYSSALAYFEILEFVRLLTLLSREAVLFLQTAQPFSFVHVLLLAWSTESFSCAKPTIQCNSTIESRNFAIEKNRERSFNVLGTRLWCAITPLGLNKAVASVSSLQRFLSILRVVIRVA
jgi:hypothetical protein